MSVHVSKQGVRHNTGGLDVRTKYVQACFSFFPLPHLSFYSPQPITSYYMHGNTWVWPVISQHLCCGRLYVPWDLCFRVCMCVFFTSFYAFPLCFSFLILWTFFEGGGCFCLPCRNLEVRLPVEPVGHLVGRGALHFPDTLQGDDVQLELGDQIEAFRRKH